MTITTAVPGAAAATVPVACAATAGFLAAGLREALSARTKGVDVVWDVMPSSEVPVGSSPAIVVCDAAAVGAMTRRWPGCAVVAVVSDYDDGPVVIAALDAGAASCVRGENVAIAAAFVIAVARRCALIPEGSSR